MQKPLSIRALLCFLLCLAPLLPLAVPARAEATELIKNGTFADSDGDGCADDWTYWNGNVAAASSTLGEDGITITADSTSGNQRLTVHQTATVEVGKTYVLTGRYNVSSTTAGSLEIRYNHDGTTNNVQYAKHTSKTDGWQDIYTEIVPSVTSLKIEFVVSSGATLTCSIDDISLKEKVEEEPEAEYVNTLLKNGTFLDKDSDGVADEWTNWNDTVTAAACTFGTDGLTITADSSSTTQRLTVHQTVSNLDSSKTYRVTGDYNVTSTSSGSLEIRHSAGTTTDEKRLAYQTSKTDGWQTFDKTVTGVTSLKIEIVVSSGATLTCSVNNFKVEEVETVAEPDYVNTLLTNGTFLDGSDEDTQPDGWTYYNGSVTAASAVIGENGGLTITAASTSDAPQRLSVYQNVKNLSADKYYKFSGEYQITEKSSGAVRIGYYANSTGSKINAVNKSVNTDSVQPFEIIFTGCTSAKLEAEVTQGATLTCYINNFKLEEITPYTVTFDANGGSGSMDAVSVAGDYVLPENGFTAPEGCYFTGWSVNGETKAVGDTVNVTADTTVKAVWGDNLLTNPTYATEDISSIPGWTYYPSYSANAGTAYTAAVADDVFTGTVKGTTNLILHQTVSMSDAMRNKTYRFTCDVKTEDLTGYAMFKVYLQNGSTQLHSFLSAQYTGDTEWTTVTLDFEVPATVCGTAVTAVKIEQYILKGTGSASFRNPKLIPTGTVAALTEGDPVNSLIQNGGYEYTISGAPAKWNKWESTGGLNAASDRENVYSALENNYSSMHLWNVNEGEDSRGSVHQSFSVTSELQSLWGQSLKIGQWVKTKDFVGDSLSLRVHYATVSGSYISKAIPVSKDSDWKYYEFIIDLPDTQFSTVKVEYLYDYAQGHVWIDNTTVQAYYKATGITLNADTVVLKQSETKDLTVTYTPSNTTVQEVTWKSSDESVATVADGKITAVANGCATVTVSHVDGMKKEIAVLVADSTLTYSETVSVTTDQNVTATGTLPEGYTYAAVAAPQYGTFLVEDGSYTYYPEKDYSGTDSMTLLVTKDGTSALAVVPLTVNAVNAAPTVSAITVPTSEGVAVTFSVNATDPENDTLTYTLTTAPTMGTVTASDEGTNVFVYTPISGKNGYDSAVFTVTDTSGNATTKTATIYIAPDTAELLDSVKTGHSRLLADNARFAELKTLVTTDDNAKAWLEDVVESVASLMEEGSEPYPYKCSDGVRLDTYGSKNVLNLAFLYRVTGETAYLNRAKTELLYLCGLSGDTYPDWHPSHLLDTAMTANGVAIAYDWLYDDLSADEKAQVEKAIYQNALVEAQKQFEGEHMFVTNENNWNYVCNGGFITAALALADHEEYGALAGEIMQRCYMSIQYGLPQYAPEGDSIEGISYWDYGTRYLVSLLASITSATEVDNPFLDAPGLDVTALYPIYMSGKAGTYNYSDNDMVDAVGYLNLWLADVYGNDSWTWYHKYYMAQGNAATVYDLLYYDPDQYGAEAPEELDAFYTSQAVTTMRSDFTDDNGSFLGFKGGLNGAPHGDIDIGSFVYDLYGYRWALDFGKENYNITGYWENVDGGTRWNYYRKNALGHNTLVFNPENGANQTFGAYAGVTEQSINNAGGGYTVLDLTDAYQENAVDVQRGFAYFHRTQVLIRDEYTLKAPGDAYWQMHTAATVAVSADGKTATLTQGDQSIALRLVGENANDSLKFETMASKPYEGLTNFEEAQDAVEVKSNEGITKIYVKAENSQKGTFNILITPTDMATPEVKALDNWEDYSFESSETEGGVVPAVLGRSLLLEGMVSVKAYMTFQDCDGNDLTPADVLANGGVEFTLADGTTLDAKLTQTDDYNGMKQYYAISFGIPAKDMDKTLTIQPYMTVDGEKVYGNADEYGVLTYAHNKITDSETSDELKSTLVGLLNYGAAAQSYFNGKNNYTAPETLMNDCLSTYVTEGYLDSDLCSLSWDDSWDAKITAASDAMKANFTKSDEVDCIGMSLLLNGAVSINYYMTAENYTAFEGRTAKLYQWSGAQYAKLAAAETALATNNATYCTEVTVSFAYNETYNRYECTAASGQIAAKEFSDTFYAVMCFTDADGTEHCTDVVAYSPAQYAENKLSSTDATLVSLVKWLVTYGDRALAYFT